MQLSRDGFPIGAAERRVACAWLLLGVAALAVSTTFALLVAASRSPVVGAWFPGQDFFHTALAMHVNLGALIWFLAFTTALWSARPGLRLAALGWPAFFASALGAVLLAVAPFVAPAHPIMANYVPVLDGPVFFAGLALFAAGVLISLLRAVATRPRVGPEGQGVLHLGTYASAWVTMTAALALVWSWLQIPPDLPSAVYYELLFWAPGHVLQIAHACTLTVAWLWLASEMGLGAEGSWRRLGRLFACLALPAVAALVLLAFYAPTDPAFRSGFSRLMAWGAVPIAGVALMTLAAVMRPAPSAWRPHGVKPGLLLSVVLLLMGLIIGLTIRGETVTVTGHYHGTVGAVGLAFMTLALRLAPQFGFRSVPPRAAAIQAVTYGLGLIAIVIGLAWSGGHGVARKTSVSMHSLEGVQQVAGMALMGIGGLVAMIGGFMFVYLFWRAVRHRAASPSAPLAYSRRAQ